MTCMSGLAGALLLHTLAGGTKRCGMYARHPDRGAVVLKVTSMRACSITPVCFTLCAQQRAVRQQMVRVQACGRAAAADTPHQDAVSAQPLRLA